MSAYQPQNLLLFLAVTDQVVYWSVHGGKRDLLLPRQRSTMHSRSVADNQLDGLGKFGNLPMIY